MRKIRKNLFIILFLFLIFLILLLVDKNKNIEYERNYFYLDTYINVKLYSNKGKEEIEKVLNKIDKLYSEYHILTNKYEFYDGIINVYYLNEKLNNNEQIEINPKLSEIIKKGIAYYEITDGYINIASSNLVDIWKKYIDKEEGIPNLDNLNKANINIEDVLIDDNTFSKRNNIKIDLGAFAKGYVTELAGDYLNSIGIDKYLIDAGGNIKAGSGYKKDNYIIGLQDPVNTNKIFTRLSVNNLSIVTSGDYQRYYEYEGVRYNHIINPFTKYPANNFKSVTVICEDSFIADIYSTYLFLVDLDTGLDIVNNNDNLEAIWYIDKDNYVKSNNFNYDIIE